MAKDTLIHTVWSSGVVCDTQCGHVVWCVTHVSCVLTQLVCVHTTHLVVGEVMCCVVIGLVHTHTYVVCTHTQHTQIVAACRSESWHSCDRFMSSI